MKQQNNYWFTWIVASVAIAFYMLGCTLVKIDAAVAPTTTTTVPQVSFAIPNYQPAWSSKVLSMLDSGIFQKLHLAKADFKRFCPNYDTLSPDKQKLAWGYMIGAITKYECDYNTNSFMEESNGDISEGLFQLTYGNAHCPKSKTQGNLRDPIVNINCAMQIMADYTSQDKLVAAGGYTSYGAASPKGLAKYWSVIRVPDSNSSHKLAEIISLTKKSPGCL